MRIACPGCAAEYEVPSASLHPRRKVRCTRCRAEWVPVQEAQTSPPSEPDRPPETAVALPHQTAMDQLAAAPPPRRSGALPAAWVLTVLILAGSAAAVVIWRGQVTRAWPASAWILGKADRVVPAQDLHPTSNPGKSAD